MESGCHAVMGSSQRILKGTTTWLCWAGQKVCSGFLYHGMANPNELFGQTNIYVKQWLHAWLMPLLASKSSSWLPHHWKRKCKVFCIPRRNSKHKGLEIAAYLLCSRNRKETQVAEAKSEVGQGRPMGKRDGIREMRAPSGGGSEQGRNLICTY